MFNEVLYPSHHILDLSGLKSLFHKLYTAFVSVFISDTQPLALSSSIHRHMGEREGEGEGKMFETGADYMERVFSPVSRAQIVSRLTDYITWQVSRTRMKS
jgi:hypothetical protein